MLQETSNNAQDLPKLNIDEVAMIENNLILFESFIEAIKHDYKNGGPQLQNALE
ncbi:664_t:CDS:2, partial [Dentiscutata heterogama]